MSGRETEREKRDRDCNADTKRNLEREREREREREIVADRKIEILKRKHHRQKEGQTTTEI